MVVQVFKTAFGRTAVGRTAILHKSDASHAMDGTTDGSVGAAAAQVQYEVVGIARTRVVFASRPKPVLA
ncbi:unnamed protein product [Hyaloperonospora brassicae]|uniref:Uncharacterized protein n=1 Tax=Hyaloperonospora brassicae TaxID=162125 RepID=A0AAV0UFD8_HYABA|nr:unnamed protein product [Hyaloperonospora brassicae]